MVDLQRASKVWDIQGFLLRDIAENPGTDLEYMFKKKKMSEICDETAGR